MSDASPHSEGPVSREEAFFEVRHAQSRVKHDLLRRYSGAWSGIILNGLGRLAREGALGRSFEAHLVYLDGFAGAGQYRRDADKPPPGPGEEPVWGSPVIALREIEAQAERYRDQFPVKVSGFLVEQHPGLYARLLHSLGAAGLATPVVEAREFKGDARGQVVLLQGDFRDVLAPALDWFGTESQLLAFVDPFGPTVDLDTLALLLRRSRTDSIVLFPFRDLAVRGGSSLKPESELAPADRGNISRTDAHFGTDRWQQIYADPRLSVDDREAAFVDLYLSQLKAADPSAVVKKVGLRSSRATDRSAYYLCMATRDAYGAFVFNDLIRDTAAAEDLEIWRDREEWLRRRDEEWGQASLFGPPGAAAAEPPATRRIEVDSSDVAKELTRRCGDGVRREYKEVLAAMAETVYTEAEVKRALTLLKGNNKAQYQSPLRRRSSVTITR